jgi:NADPH:quinone reductase-like Zn-dependent oxidoreductase
LQTLQTPLLAKPKIKRLPESENAPLRINNSLPRVKPKVFNLAGKIALVTGSTSGIGKVAAMALAKQGATVIVSGRRESEGESVVKEIIANGGSAIH